MNLLRRCLKDEELTFGCRQVLLDECKQISNLFLGTESALQNVAIWKLDSDLRSCVVSLSSRSFELERSLVSKLRGFLVVGKQFDCSGKLRIFLLLIIFFLAVHVSTDLHTLASATG